jgi:1,2-diacylglycerol 3-beta-galactosyltransferase
MPQERWNARWIREAGLGLTVRSLRQLPEAVAHLLGQLDTYARAVASHDNRALFEVVDRLEALLASSRSELAA